MGNKIGFEVDSELVKLAYVEEDPCHVKFITGLNSKYLRSKVSWGNYYIFLFQCTIEEFISYHTTDNVGLLRNEYQKLLSSSKLMIKTNRETINILSENKKLYNVLRDILMKQFYLQHIERIDNSVFAMHQLQKNFMEFFNFKNIFNITKLHNFSQQFQYQKKNVKHLPQKFIMVNLRNGISGYRIENGEIIEKVSGSIIGEKTILNIMKYKFPGKSIGDYFNTAFNQGDIKKTDLIVEDIYGASAHNLGLPSDLVASSLGKIGKMSKEELQKLKDGDIMRTLLTTFAINTGNLISLYLHKSNLNDAIVLADFFHDDRFYAMTQSICESYAPGKQICFSNHAPFFGCLGTAFNNNLA